MSYPVNLHALPSGVLEEVFTPENMRGRNSVSSYTQLSFPKSRSALWDGSPAGEKLRLHLCSHRKLHLVLLEKALRLAQRHARHSNKPRLQCFFLGSVSVNPDEEGITVTLDRFDPGRDQARTAGRDQAGTAGRDQARTAGRDQARTAGRDQAGTAGRVPSTLLPGDILVPCLFSVQSETTPDAVVQSEAELRQCFKALQQFVSSRQTLDLSRLLNIRVHVFGSQRSDAAAFSLSWSAVCPAVSVDVQPVRAVPIIPTALLRSLTCVGRPLQSTGRRRGFLSMDQTRKLVLLLESDPKASSLPLVGLWLSGVTHIYNPQVWAWSLRFMFSSALQDRVLSESGCFLLVVFGSTHRTPQFFQCRGPGPGPGPGPQLDFQLLTASQSATLYQVAPVEGRVLQCVLGPEEPSRQDEVFRAAQKSFSSSPRPTAGLSVSDQDSGLEDEDFSPRPSPSPHPLASQARRVQPSVPELSLLIDSSFSSNHNQAQHSGSTPRPLAADKKSAPPISSSSAPKPAPPPPHLHSTPNSNLQEPCTCCSTHTYNFTPIFSSPALPLATAPPVSHQQTPPPSTNRPSTPPVPPTSSHQKTPPFSSHHSAAPLTHKLTPPPNLHSVPPPPPSHQQTNTPSTPLFAPLHQTALPPPPNTGPSTPPFPLSSSHQQTPPPSSRLSAPVLSLHPQTSSCFGSPPPPLSSSYQHTAPSSPHPAPSLPSVYHCATPTHSPSTLPVPPPSTCRLPPSDLPNSPPSTPLLSHNTPPSCPCNHPPPPLPLSWYCDSPSSHPSCPAADPMTPPLLPRPPCVSHCCDKMGGVAPSDTYQLLLHQDRQLRLLQAQIQMLLEAQGKLQVDTQTPRSTASIAVETGASLFWGGNPDTSLHQEEQQGPKSSSSSSSSLSASSHDLSLRRPAAEPEEENVLSQEASCSTSDQHSISGLQSPVLGESVSMYEPPDEQQNFYQDLMTQLNSRLQESDHNQEAERSRGSSLSASNHSQSSQSSTSSSQRKKQQKKKKNPDEDPVIRATLRQLQQLGVDVNQKDLIESKKHRIRAMENVSTLASINPAAVVSRLGVSDLSSNLLPGDSVDLSLEANAIALRYLTDSQLNRLSLGGHAPQHVPTPSSGDSIMSPSNMSLATRKYMRRYGLIEDDDGEEDEDQEEEVRGQEARQPLSDALNMKFLPQSQLIRDLRPKMHLLARSTKPDTNNKENCSGRRISLVRESSRESEGSVGNILDLSRLRQLPKLF